MATAKSRAARPGGIQHEPLSAALFPTWDRAIHYATNVARICNRKVVVVKRKDAWRWGWAK